MQHMYRTVSGAVLWALASTSALAQTATKPITLKFPYPEIEAEGAPILPKLMFDDPEQGKPDSLIPLYISRMHAVALRGITFADSTAVKKLVIRHLEDMKADPAHPKLKNTNNDPDPNAFADARKKWNTEKQQFDSDFYRKRLPELRLLVPSGQQTIFDQNLKALEASNYTLYNEEGRWIASQLGGSRPKK